MGAVVLCPHQPRLGIDDLIFFYGDPDVMAVLKFAIHN